MLKFIHNIRFLQVSYPFLYLLGRHELKMVRVASTIYIIYDIYSHVTVCF
jgi:hypothetical protein